jgi:hypothetical protein
MRRESNSQETVTTPELDAAAIGEQLARLMIVGKETGMEQATIRTAFEVLANAIRPACPSAPTDYSNCAKSISR